MNDNSFISELKELLIKYNIDCIRSPKDVESFIKYNKKHNRIIMCGFKFDGDNIDIQKIIPCSYIEL